MQIHGFEMMDKLGQGGMASVWKARQLSLDRVVAVKMLSSGLGGTDADIERFLAEARSTAKLKHPGIVQIYDVRHEEGSYYFVMEFISGYTVGDWMRRKGTLPEEDALLVAECVADALSYAWGKARIIHCDIKPDNVLVDEDGTVKVADLGLARTISTVTDDAQLEEIMGTPSFISPEQALGEPDMDYRTDIYALGAMLYNLVTGRCMFDGKTDDEIMDLQVSGKDEDPVDVNPEVSNQMGWLIEKMLSKDKDTRQRDWDEVIADIARVKRGHVPSGAIPVDGHSSISRSECRTKSDYKEVPYVDEKKSYVVPVLAGLAVVLLLAGFWFAASSAIRHIKQKKQARIEAAAEIERNAAEKLAREKMEKRAEEMYAFADKWALENTNDLSEAIKQFKLVVDQTKGSKFALMARTRIDEIQIERDEALNNVMKNLDSEASEFIDREEFEYAVGVYEGYNGAYEQESKKRRSERVKDIRKQGIDLAQKKQRAEASLSKRIDMVYDKIASGLLSGGIVEAWDVVSKAMSDDEISEIHDDLSDIRALLDNAVRIDQRIIESFEDQKGEEVTVVLVSGKKACKIISVRNGTISTMQEFGVRGVKAPLEFRIEDLAPRERLLRMGADDLPDVALVKGLMAYSSQAYEYARKYFSATHPLISQRLIEKVAEEEGVLLDQIDEPVESSSSEADDSAPATPPSVDFFTDDDEAVQVEPVNDPDVVKRNLFDSNPGLSSHHYNVHVRKDDKGDIYRVEIASPLVTDLSPLRNVVKLRELACSPFKVSEHWHTKPVGKLKTLEPLKGLPLEMLHVAVMDIKDLSPLANMPLKHLNARNTKVSDVSPLKGLPLEYLNLNGTNVEDLKPLRGMELSNLSVGYTRVRDLKLISEFPLSNLDISGTQIKRLTSLKVMKELEHLNIAATPTYDFSTLSGMDLKSLDLSDTQFKSDRVLKGMPLESLRLSNTKVSRLDVLSGTKLHRLNLDGSKLISDFSFLEGLPLTFLWLSDTRIKDIEILSGLPLKDLNISNTHVSDLSPLEGMKIKYLRIENTNIGNIDLLATFPLELLYCRGIKASNYQALRGLPIKYLNIDDTGSSAVREIISTLPNLRYLNGRWYE